MKEAKAMTDGSRTADDAKADANKLPPVLTVLEAAQVLRIGKNRTYELCHEKKIPHVKIGHSIRIPRDALLRWMEEEATRIQDERHILTGTANSLRPPWKRLKTS